MGAGEAARLWAKRQRFSSRRRSGEGHGAAHLACAAMAHDLVACAESRGWIRKARRAA